MAYLCSFNTSILPPATHTPPRPHRKHSTLKVITKSPALIFSILNYYYFGLRYIP